MTEHQLTDPFCNTRKLQYGFILFIYFFIYFYFNSVLRPFQENFSSYETGESVGGRKRENPENNHLEHPQADLGLSHDFNSATFLSINI